LERVQRVEDKNGLFLKYKTIPRDKELLPQNYNLRLRKAGEESSDVL
jgi:hypothetical protein